MFWITLLLFIHFKFWMFIQCLTCWCIHIIFNLFVFFYIVFTTIHFRLLVLKVRSYTILVILSFSCLILINKFLISLHIWVSNFLNWNFYELIVFFLTNLVNNIFIFIWNDLRLLKFTLRFALFFLVHYKPIYCQFWFCYFYWYLSCF